MMCFPHSLLLSFYGTWTGILLLKYQKNIGYLNQYLINQHNNFFFLLRCLYALMSIDSEMHAEERGFLRVT